MQYARYELNICCKISTCSVTGETTDDFFITVGISPDGKIRLEIITLIFFLPINWFLRGNIVASSALHLEKSNINKELVLLLSDCNIFLMATLLEIVAIATVQKKKTPDKAENRKRTSN